MEDGTKEKSIVYINCEETLQYSFASHLSMEFREKGVTPLVNSKGTIDVLERASASVVVLSKDCLSSASCLDKLVMVLQYNMLVVPVFYCISPSDVVVMEHESSCSAEQIRKWSSVLQKIRELPGHQSREDCSDSELVEEIVKYVYERLFPMQKIGMSSRLVEIEHLLCKQPWGIRRIGIWGMPGIGKTTLAKAVFDHISGGYEASCFIQQFDKVFHEKGFHRLLEEHFGNILKELPRACSSITRRSLPGNKLRKKRTLVVLDDVHSPMVVESFLGGFHWFGPGSLIIIISRDKQVFRHCKINHVYEVQSLNGNEAMHLFSQCAFGKDIIEEEFLELAMEVIDYAGGNPLAVGFYGKGLKGKKLSDMETSFLKLKLRTPFKIHDLFKSSYETLNENEKNIFLDIACFFKGEDVDYVLPLFEGCGFFPHVGIDVLMEKCLVTIPEKRVIMHNLIQNFGRTIIKGETVHIERRSRLWEPWSIKFLLEDKESYINGDPQPQASHTHALGTEDNEGIFLDTSNLTFDVKPGAFENMFNLRFLKIYCSSDEKRYGLRLPKGLASLPCELRLLHWENYPLQSLPQDFEPCHLVELNMPLSQLQRLWGGTKNLEKLKVIRLCHSQELTEIYDICKAPNIELIDLQGCIKLQRFLAMGKLQHLQVVNLSGCTEIRSFPEVSPNIQELHLQGTGISELPRSIVTLSPQVKLNLELSNLISEFPEVSDALNHERLKSMVETASSNLHLGKLVCLNMKDCLHLRSLPNMVHLESLKFLYLSGCSGLDDIQGFPRNLKELYLADTAIKELPQLPWSIEIVNAHGCASLISIPSGFEHLPRYYTFSNCFALSAQLINTFLKNALGNVERIAREYQQEQNLHKYLAFSFTVPSPTMEDPTFDMQPGSSVMIQLGSSWRRTIGFVILVEVSFLEDYHEASGFDISCVCRWKDKEFFSHRLEKSFHCWTPGKGVPKDHMFVFCDLNMPPRSCEGNDPSILADLVIFEFCTVNKQKKLLDESCTVTKCGVHVITAANEDLSSNMTKLLPPSENLQEIFDDEVEEVEKIIYDILHENDRNLFLYITCLFTEEEVDFLAAHIASIGLGISSRLNFLANKSLIHISPYGIIVRHGLLQKIGREFGRVFENTCMGKSVDVASKAGVNSHELVNEENERENLPQSFKIHSSMCLELKNLVNKLVRILPDIEDTQWGRSSGIQTLHSLHKALDKAKLLLHYCSTSSKLYMAVTGDAILSRGCRAKNSLEQSLKNIRSMVPTVLGIKISQLITDIRSTVMTLKPSEEEAGKAIREMMRQITSSSVSLDETRYFHFAALKLELLTSEAIAIERRSLKSLYAKLSDSEVNKGTILKYLLCLLKKHERIISRDEENSFLQHHRFVHDSEGASVVEAGYSEEHNATLPEHFNCPLSLTVMYDPVIISSGYTFEKIWIQKWFDEGNDTCPKSKRRLDDFTLKPNVAIKDQISKWCSKNDLDLQDPAMKYAKGLKNIDYSVSINTFNSWRNNISDPNCFSITDSNTSCSIDSASFMADRRIDSDFGTDSTDSNDSEMDLEPLCELVNLPWDEQVKLIEDVRSHFEKNARAFRSMSPSKFLEPLTSYLKNALEINGAAGEIKGGLDLLLAFLSGNRRAVESLDEDVFKMFAVFLESEVVAEEALNVLEVLSNHPHGLSKITSSGSLASLLNIAESGPRHLQEQVMITLNNLSSSNGICLELVSPGFVRKLTSFLQENVVSKQSVMILKNLCNTEIGRVCITETPGCLASIADFLESNVPEEQENAISILLQLCVEKMEYCYLVVREGVNIYSSLLLISNNGTEEAKVGAAELLRALEEVDLNNEEEEDSFRPEVEAVAPTTSEVVTYQEPKVTTQSPKKSGLFEFNFPSLKKKKAR